MTPYDKLLNRKRKWSPVQTTAGKLQDGAEETLLRALAMRHMEVPVGDFIQEALKSEIPETARELLVSNVRDEERHDLALGYIAEAHGVDEKAEQEAIRIRDAWIYIQITQFLRPWSLKGRSSMSSFHSSALTVNL